MSSLYREIENMSHANKKGVKDIFEYMVKKAIFRDGASDYRKEDYKQLLKFVDVIYMSISSTYEKNILSKLDDYSYSIVKDKFAVVCRNISYNNFALWIRNNKNEFSLYNINAKTIEDRYLQIAFYEDVKQIMYYVYEVLNYDSYGIVKKNYDNSKKIYELLRKELGYYDKRENVYEIYEDKSIYELETMLSKLEGKAGGERDTVSEKEILEEMYHIVEEILCRKDLNKVKFDNYYRKKKELFIALRKIKHRSLKEEYRIKLSKDIRDKNVVFDVEDDPRHRAIVKRCVEILEKQPKLNVDELIDKVEKEIANEEFETKKIQVEDALNKISVEINGNRMTIEPMKRD